MGYGLGVDLGTTFTAAAVDRDGRVEMASLGDRAAAVPSVILIREDGSVLTGDAAERRAATDPDRVAREVKRRFGDPMPLILGGSPYAAGDLMAQQLRDVVRTVSEREGGMPDVVTLTHPANWGPYKREMFDQIPRQAGVRNVRMITEPEAAAAHYASNERLEEGATVAVYDLGGGTFDATVLRTTGDGFEILGTPEGIEGLGGIDFDEAVFAHVDRVLDGPVAALDPSDPRATSAVIRLRQDCTLAKEALSADTEATIPVMLPSVQTEVRLTRGEFEDMIRPSIGSTIASLRRALESARVHPGELSTVLLVGGSSRIPLVSHLVSAELGRPTAVDAHPKHAIVLGAAGTSAVPGDAAKRSSTLEDGAGGPAAAIGPRTGPWGMNAVTTATPAAGLDATRTAALHGQAPGPRTTVASGPMSGPIPAQNPAPGPVRNPTPVGAPAPGMPAPALAGEQAPDRKRRVPLVIAAALLLAVLAGGGTYAYRVASATTAPAPTGATVQAPDPAPVPAPVVAPPIAPPAEPPPTVAPRPKPAPAAPAPPSTPSGSQNGSGDGGWKPDGGSNPGGHGGDDGGDHGGGDGGDHGGGDGGGGDGGGGDGGGSMGSQSSGTGE